MKKAYIILGSIGLFILIIFISYWSSYNKAIKLQENVDEAWGNVGATYQRRADLIPQLVATVKGAAENEKGILVQVTQHPLILLLPPAKYCLKNGKVLLVSLPSNGIPMPKKPLKAKVDFAYLMLCLISKSPLMYLLLYFVK